MKLLKSIVLTLGMLTCGITAKSQTGAELVAAVKALDEVANNALNKADDMLSNQQRTIYMNLANYTKYLTGQIKYLLDDLDRKLTDKEIALLNEVKMISSTVTDQSIQIQKKLEDVSTIMENSIANTWIGNKYPRPTFYDIPLITTLQNKTINIDIKGVRLNSYKNYIVFNKKKVPVTSISSDKLISFAVPLTSNDVFDPTITNTFEVYLFKKTWLIFNKKYRYNPKFVVVPGNIGKVTVFYKVGYQETETKTGYSSSVSATSGSRKTKDVHKQFNIVNNSSEGWKIDKFSINCRKSSGNGKKHGYGFDRNNATDISFIAKAYAKDGKAVCTCTWNEYRVVNKDSIQSKDITIAFNEQKVEIFPPNYIQHFKTEVTYSDGTKFTSMLPRFKENYLEFTVDQLKRQFQVNFSR